jgi:hypothetical protein
MARRLPLILGVLAATATLLLVGPVAVAVMLLRSSSDAEGPMLAAQIFIALVVLALAAVAGLAAWAVTRLILRLFGGGK